jgi:GNAT superfamily N-acetyltransferase
MTIHKLIIREMVEADCAVISGAFAAQGWDKPLSQYQAYLQESREGQRVVLVAEYEGQFAGYVTIVWESAYPPFRAAQIPEIVDFNVLLKYRRRGIGTVLLDEAEKRISVHSPVAGIGVGLTEDYGPAHIMYIKRGYLPDGRGLFQQGKHLNYGDQAIVNDDLVLCFTKLL